MSSLRNAVQRRNHRERAQPVEREKWGILEKHKDYKLRAADHRVKKQKIKALKEKASTRNEDEFYFAMLNSSSRGGVKQTKRGEENSGGGGKSLSVDVVKLLKTQDHGYLQTMLQKTRRERERLEQDVAIHATGVSDAPSRRRTVFDENGGVVATRLPSSNVDGGDLDGLSDMSGSDELDDFDSMPPLALDKSMDSEESDSQGKKLSSEELERQQEKQRALGVKRRKLAALREQEQKLSQALDGVDHQRAKMNGTVGGVNKKGLRFKMRHRKK